jgi:hypothetical protein
VRNPLSLRKLVYLDGQQAVLYRSRMNPSLGRNFEALSPLEWLARMSDHIPDPGQHRTVLYGQYANRPRGAGRRDAAQMPEASTEPPRRRSSPTWARLIAKIYRVDPLVCTRCGQKMQMIAFLTDQLSIRKILDHLGLSAPPQDKPPPAREILRVAEQGEVVISYSWASNLVFRAAGEPPAPFRPPGPAQGGREAGGPSAASWSGLDALVPTAQAHRAARKAISARLPRDAGAPVVFSVDAGTGGEPHKRDTVTIDRRGTVVKVERFADVSRGIRWRIFMRFAHTGEVLGIVGQTIAGIASLGACVLAYTGAALSWRRWRNWRRRRAASRGHRLPRPIEPFRSQRDHFSP